MAESTDYGDISPRTAAYASKRLLKRAIPYLVIEKFGQPRPLPRKHSDTITFRRFERFPHTPTPLTEGVTPSARKLQTTDIKAVLKQYGDRIQITDKIQDTHEDPVLSEAVDILGEQSAQMLETVRFHVIRAGTNVFYAGNVASRDKVVGTVDLDLQRRIMRQLKRQDARKMTRVIKSTPSYATQPVNACYIAICHPDCENDIRDIKGFTPVENYGTMPPFESEVGKVEDMRYVTSTILEGWEGEGGTISGEEAGKAAVLSTGGEKADVYPILYVAKDAYGIIPLKGEGAVRPMVVNPKPSDSDPLAQRGHAGWKAYQTACILNDAWMVRAEVAVSS
ncbi:N4-gp56 family major capsid protein [Bacterioplanoides sp.]|uniref:N4-gp56 family major capsid protein n=1 Tax=Bacterioplanoides sp. TaxID=2066072 RepID=UPI003B5A2E62